MCALKKLLIVVFLFSTTLLMSGWRFYVLKKHRPLLLFNSRPITAQTINHTTRFFKVGEKIHFIMIVPKGIKDDHIRVQLVKKEDKTEHWGYKIYWAQDYRVEKGDNSFIS